MSRFALQECSNYRQKVERETKPKNSTETALFYTVCYGFVLQIVKLKNKVKMAVKIIKKAPDKKVSKRCICKNCGATLEYTPNDVTYKVYQDYGGGSDRYAEFNCPNCGKLQHICQ